MNKYSRNNKLNAVLCDIEGQLMDMGDTPVESLSEIKRYMHDFPREPDYNIVQYGNLLVYYGHVREIYRSCGYSNTQRYSDDYWWETYKRQVGYVARRILETITPEPDDK